MEYRRHEQPGCGGCLLIAILLAFLFGGAPLLFDLLGLLLFSGLLLILAVVAVFFGISYYIKRQVNLYERSQTEAHNKFVSLLVNILIKIAQIDGTVSKEEIDTIYNFFRFNLHYAQSQLYWVRDLIKDAARQPASLEDLLAEFRHNFAYEPRLILLELIYQVIFTKDKFIDSELELARDIADYLDISYLDREAIHAKYTVRMQRAAAEEERYYKILGLTPGADFEEVKSAYRKLSMKYHPDKVGHLGEEFRKIAEEKMKDLNIAYQYLKEKAQ